MWFHTWPIQKDISHCCFFAKETYYYTVTAERRENKSIVSIAMHTWSSNVIQLNQKGYKLNSFAKPSSPFKCLSYGDKKNCIIHSDNVVQSSVATAESHAHIGGTQSQKS